MTGYSRKQVEVVCGMLGLECEYEGFGYVFNSSVATHTDIKSGDKIKFEFK